MSEDNGGRIHVSGWHIAGTVIAFLMMLLGLITLLGGTVKTADHADWQAGQNKMDIDTNRHDIRDLQKERH